MPAGLQEVKDIIMESFDGVNVDGVVKTPDERIVGVILWDGFSKYDGPTRNKLVTERIRNKLGLKGLNIGYLLPKAPGEA